MISNIEWLNENKNRNYPFLEGVTRQDRVGITGQRAGVAPKVTLPNDFLLDLRLSGTKSFEIVNGVYTPIDYFIFSIERVGSTKFVITIREIQRGLYSESTSSTFTDVGTFEIPFGQSKNSVVPFNKVSLEKIEGNLVVGKPLDSSIPVGVYTFNPTDSTLEARTCVPFPEENTVTSISKYGGTNLLKGNVNLKGGKDCTVTPLANSNALNISFNKDSGIDCNDTNLCDEDKQCPQPALMSMSGVEGDRGFNLNVRGVNGVQISALVQLKTGGDPFEPTDYSTTGLLATYHGPMVVTYNSGPLDSPDSYTYDLDCSKLKDGASVQDLLTQVNELLNKASTLF